MLQQRWHVFSLARERRLCEHFLGSLNHLFGRNGADKRGRVGAVTLGEVRPTDWAGEPPGYQWSMIASERQSRGQQIKAPVETHGSSAYRLGEIERAGIV